MDEDRVEALLIEQTARNMVARYGLPGLPGQEEAMEWALRDAMRSEQLHADYLRLATAADVYQTGKLIRAALGLEFEQEYRRAREQVRRAFVVPEWTIEDKHETVPARYWRFRWWLWRWRAFGYVLRPYDMLADRRRWWWQPRERCGLVDAPADDGGSLWRWPVRVLVVACLAAIAVAAVAVAAAGGGW
jgi:hypothetical protein